MIDYDLINTYRCWLKYTLKVEKSNPSRYIRLHKSTDKPEMTGRNIRLSELKDTLLAELGRTLHYKPGIRNICTDEFVKFRLYKMYKDQWIDIVNIKKMSDNNDGLLMADSLEYIEKYLDNKVYGYYIGEHGNKLAIYRWDIDITKCKLNINYHIHYEVLADYAEVSKKLTVEDINRVINYNHGCGYNIDPKELLKSIKAKLLNRKLEAEETLTEAQEREARRLRLIDENLAALPKEGDEYIGVKVNKLLGVNILERNKDYIHIEVILNSLLTKEEVNSFISNNVQLIYAEMAARYAVRSRKTNEIINKIPFEYYKIANIVVRKGNILFITMQLKALDLE